MGANFTMFVLNNRKMIQDMTCCHDCGVKLTLINNSHDGDHNLCESCHKKAKVCGLCNGEMDWCNTCETYTSTCCCDYGTCGCS